MTAWSRRTGSAYALATALCLLSPAALAQGRPASDGWEARLGVLGLVAPDYEGSDDYELNPVPDVEISYADRFFFGRRGLGVNLLTGRDSPITAGISVAYDGGRDEDENDALRGLGDVDGTAVVRSFLTYSVGKLALTAEAETDVLGDGHDGTLATLSATYMFTPTPDLILFAGPAVTWADKDYTQSYFGITGAQAARSGRAAYGASSGVKDVSATLVGLYGLTDNWVLTGIAGYKRLLGDAADSPLVEVDGDADQLFGGLGISYRF